MPGPEEITELALAAGTPVVEIVRTAYTDDGYAVEVNEMVADAGAYVFPYDFTTTRVETPCSKTPGRFRMSHFRR
jgi:GntR family transcriptional regulator